MDIDTRSLSKAGLASPEPITTLADTRVEQGAEVSDRRLEELGYKPEFRRDMSLFGVLGISFCAIGILTGMSSAFQTGLFSGGPLGLFWGWNVCYCLLFDCKACTYTNA